MLARFSVLFVNLWIAYPYFLLVCTGALTAIPGDLKEAAFVDGASGLHAFRTVVLPLLMISVGAAADRLLRLQLQQLHPHRVR